MSPPTPEIIEAFGLSGIPVWLHGGRGLCYLVGETVFKPSDNDTELQWVAELTTKLLRRSPTSYQLSKPRAVVDQPNTFIFNGWTASLFLSGAIEVGGDFEEVLQVCRTFHADLAELSRVKHAAIVSRSNRWDEADKVTWGEKKLDDVLGVDQTVLSYLNPILEKLVQAKEPLTERVELQFIHADLAGNVLFQEDPKELPAIIDLTLYWRPARYAEAIIVADALTWNGKGRELIQYYGTDEHGRQLLVRALYWRCLTWAINPETEWMPDGLLNLVQRYRTAAEMVCKTF
jgi:uncharacterized protein (TIGR02569 family)